jgi:hypothetical protein
VTDRDLAALKRIGYDEDRSLSTVVYRILARYLDQSDASRESLADTALASKAHLGELER